MKPKKKWLPLIGIPLIAVAALTGVLVTGYAYLMSGLERDSFVSAEDLSVVDTGSIIREPMPETAENGVLNENGDFQSIQLPEEALAVLRRESTGTGVDISDAEPVETTEEIVWIEPETEPETEKETKPPETRPAETKKETKAPETRPVETKKETKAPETRPAETKKETKAPETKPAGDIIQIGSGVSYLKPGAEKIKLFVLYGLDEKKASDVIILTALDPVHNKCKIISIARDTYTYLSDRKAHTKMNYAFSMGGAPLAVKALNENLYLHLEDYIAVDYTQATSVIDLLGGASVDLDEKELPYMGLPGGSEPGIYNLNGKQAVNYARLREIDNDLKRNDRQREVIKSIFTNFRTLKITDYPALFREAAGMCTTSFSDTELIALGTTFLSMKGCTFEQYSYPNGYISCWGGLIDEQFYWVYDLAEVSDEIYRIIYEDLYVSGYTGNG
ncbi:MAG: LCP family protein [Clostridia bacterium]|nr:LCP family protein [Clostridia bacterium]